jgi:hypothetical protein
MLLVYKHVVIGLPFKKYVRPHARELKKTTAALRIGRTEHQWFLRVSSSESLALFLHTACGQLAKLSRPLLLVNQLSG